MNDAPDRERPGRAFFIEVVAAAMAIFVMAVTIGLVFNAPVGSVADWVAATATLAAFIAAAVAAWYAARAYGIEDRRDAARLFDAQSAQASLVSAWSLRLGIDPDSDYPAHEHDSSQPPVLPSIWKARAVVANTSGTPIFDVRVEFNLVTFAGQPEGLAARTVESDGVIGVARIDQMPPGVEQEVDVPGINARSPLYLLDDDPETVSMRVAVTFLDATNREWRRDFTGELRLLRDRSTPVR